MTIESNNNNNRSKESRVFLPIGSALFSFILFTVIISVLGMFNQHSTGLVWLTFLYLLIMGGISYLLPLIPLMYVYDAVLIRISDYYKNILSSFVVHLLVGIALSIIVNLAFVCFDLIYSFDSLFWGKIVGQYSALWMLSAISIPSHYWLGAYFKNRRQYKLRQ